MYYVSAKSFETQKEDLKDVAVKLIDSSGKVIVNKKNVPLLVSRKTYRYKGRN